MEVSSDSYDSCDTTSPISVENSGPANITLTTAGTHYYICAYSGHCQADMKVAIDVTAPSTSEPSPAPSTPEPTPAPSPPPTVPEPTSSPSPAPKTSPSPAPKTSPSPAPVTSPAPSPSGPQTYVVGGSTGWTFAPGGARFYQTWAANKTFSVGDTLVFNFINGTHNVAEVSRDSFDTCNRTSLILVNNTGPASIKLTKGGAHYYICAFTGHCNAGMKLAINVTGASTPTSSPGPSSSTPTTPSSPSVTPPPPPSSAPSFAGAALPISLLAVALAFFY